MMIEQYITAGDRKDGYVARITFHGRKIDGEDFFWGYHEIESDAPETVIKEWQEWIYDFFDAEKYAIIPHGHPAIGSVANVDAVIVNFFRKPIGEIMELRYENCDRIDYDAWKREIPDDGSEIVY